MKEFLRKPNPLCHPFSCVNLNVRIPKVGYKQTWPFLNRFQDCRATMCFIFYCGLSEWAISELHFNLLRMVLTCMFWVSGVSCIMLYLNISYFLRYLNQHLGVKFSPFCIIFHTFLVSDAISEKKEITSIFSPQMQCATPIGWSWYATSIHRQSLIFLPTTKILLAISMQIWTLLSSQENIQPTFQ